MKTCLIVGDPIAHSLSPAVHNAGYRALGIDTKYRYDLRQVKPDELEAFMREVRDTGIRGVSCTAPHKEAIMQYLDEIDPVAAKIGAVNTVVNDGGRLTGHNTDWMGAVLPLERLTALRGKKVALLGAGGAARSIAYGITERGAELTIFNRTPGKAEKLGEEFNAAAASLENPETIKRMDIIINATSAGMDDPGTTPVPQEYLHDKHIVFDSVYVPLETRLLKEAAANGARVVHGTEMLLQQALAQFRLYTGQDAPEAAMRTSLEQALKERGE